MLIVADTSPLRYLTVIGAQEILPRLFQQVLIPEAVFAELTHEKAPAVVRESIRTPPDWLTIQSPASPLPLEEVDPGEQAAISLAVELSADTLLIDDLKGRQVAVEHGLVVTGTLGVLVLAADKHLLDLRETIDRLLDEGFHVSEQVLRDLLDAAEG